MPTNELAGLTVKDVARRYRVGRGKVLAWINRGELKAINVSSVLCGKTRFVILPDHLAAFEQRRSAGPPPKPLRRRQQRPSLMDQLLPD
jgi:hypothetical protein